MELLLILYLHQNIVHARIDEEFDRLMASGATHRDVLEDHYSKLTIQHIALMESEGEKEIIITDETGMILESSDWNDADMKRYVADLREREITEDQIIEDDIKNKRFIISVHPYSALTGDTGLLIMFQSAKPIDLLIKKQNGYMILSGIFSLFILCIVYSLLARYLTRPLIRMKEATEKLSQGDFNVKLPSMGNDELGELSSSIQKLATDLDQLKKERIEFFASVSHELSTPLTYLIGYSKVAKRKELHNEERAHYLTIIEEEANRMKILLKNFMDLVKIDELNFTVEKSNFFIKPFLQNMYKLTNPSFQSRNMTLILRCPEDFEIFQDRTRLEQILLNLLDNALHYSEEGTSVVLEAAKDQNQTIIRVIDEGIGIPLEDQGRIFEKMYRVEKSRSRAYGGTGLGLAIVKDLIEALDGSIEVQSRPGKGSCFTIIL